VNLDYAKMETFPIPKNFPYSVESPTSNVIEVQGWLLNRGLVSGFGYIAIRETMSTLVYRFRDADNAMLFKLAWGQRVLD
jgi:hypothetical protein